MTRSVISRRLMKLNGLSQTMTFGARPAPLGAIVPVAAIKAVTMRSLVHLILWVSLEQRVQE